VHVVRAALAALLALGSFSASAATVNIGLDQPFFANPCTSTAQCAPYVTAKISDIGSVGSNQVQIELSLSSSVPRSWFLYELLLNFGPNGNDALDPGKLKFEHVSGQNVIEKNGIDGRTNAHLGRGDGFFDIRFEFPSSLAPNVDRFLPGDTAVFRVSSSEEKFSAVSFFNLSCRKSDESRCSPASADPVFVAGAQLLDSSLGRVSWIYDAQPIPVPAAAWLLGAGLVGLARLGRRQRASA
jgi:hypothetical protein